MGPSRKEKSTNRSSVTDDEQGHEGALTSFIYIYNCCMAELQMMLLDNQDPQLDKVKAEYDLVMSKF